MDFPAQVGVGIGAFVATNTLMICYISHMIFFANRRFPVSNWSLAIHWKGVAHRRQSLRFTHCFGCPKQSDRTGWAFSNCNRNQKELLELCKTNENDKDDEKELHREITFAEQEDIAVYAFLTLAAVKCSGGEEKLASTLCCLPQE
jgi:hypothetical protein